MCQRKQTNGVTVVVKNTAEDVEAAKASQKRKNRLETKHFKTISGRGRRLRTLGLRFWRPPLYQLSYSPVFIFSPQTSIEVVDRQGLEPRTDRL